MIFSRRTDIVAALLAFVWITGGLVNYYHYLNGPYSPAKHVPIVIVLAFLAPLVVLSYGALIAVAYGKRWAFLVLAILFGLGLLANSETLAFMVRAFFTDPRTEFLPLLLPRVLYQIVPFAIFLGYFVTRWMALKPPPPG